MANESRYEDLADSCICILDFVARYAERSWLREGGNQASKCGVGNGDVDIGVL